MGLFERRETGGSSPATAGASASLWRRLFRRLPLEIRLAVLAPFYLAIPTSIVLGSAFVYYTAAIPDPKILRQKERPPLVRILARDGSVLAERNSAETYAGIDTLPQHLLDAVVATEDRRFYEHWGVDPTGLARAALANLREGRFTQGGSTLTQQLAKNLFLSPKRTLGRKFEELILALWLEVRLNKRDILETYLNRVYFGGGAYGVETAARRFFGKSAHELSLGESAVLAGLLKAPSKFSPASNPDLALGRARTVLAKMVEAGLISAQDVDASERVPIRFADSLNQRETSGVEYAVDAVLERLPPLIGPEGRDLIVETTIDAGLQRRAQKIVSDLMAGEGRTLDASQAGLVLLDMDGGVRAVVGGRSYAESQFNRALKARRQPGSTFKPFVYLAALESGLTPDSIVQDLPILGSGWSPRNEGGKYRGNVTLRDGLALSMNAAAARLNIQVGPRRTVAVAHRLGIQSELRAEAALALGTSEVTLLELTGAYGVLANEGRSLVPHMVRRVRTGSGNLIYEMPIEAPKVLVAGPQVGAMNDMLNAVIVSGTGKKAALTRYPAAGKTGTSQDFRDAWFVGYTAQFVAGVWIGNDDGRPMQRVMGGNLPARLWHEVMLLAHDGVAPRALPGTALVAANGPLARQASARLRDEVAADMSRDVAPDDPIARALAEDANTARDSGPASRTWSGSALDKVLRGLGLNAASGG